MYVHACEFIGDRLMPVCVWVCVCRGLKFASDPEYVCRCKEQ